MDWQKTQVHLRRLLRSEYYTNGFTWISGIAALLMLAVWTIGAARHASIELTKLLPDPIWDEFWAYRYGIVAVCIFTIFLVYSLRLKYLKRHARGLMSNRSSIAEANANATHNFVSVLQDMGLIKEMIIKRGPRPEESVRWIKKRTREGMDQLCTESSRILTILTGHPTRVCFKKLEGTKVTAKSRSAKSRESNPEEYETKENTAFDSCMHGEAYYLNNFLLLEAPENYENANKDWKASYDATLVLKVENPHPLDIGQQSVFGFVCADNIGGDLDDDACLETLRELGSMCRHIYTELEKINDLQADHATSLADPNRVEHDNS